MANMSYCRFENTGADLADVEDALGEIQELSEIESDSERRAAKRLIARCIRIAGDWSDRMDE